MAARLVAGAYTAVAGVDWVGGGACAGGVAILEVGKSKNFNAEVRSGHAEGTEICCQELSG